MNRRRTGWVYFLKPIGREGPIKLGFSEMVENRIKAYFFWSPDPLELIAKLPATDDVEPRLHAKFKAQHLHHEWFAPSFELHRVLRDVKAGVFDVSTLPEPECLWAKGKKWSEEAKLAARLGRRVEAAKRAGAAMPPEVARAMLRFANNPYRVGWGHERNPADAKVVEAWLAEIAALRTEGKAA